MDIATLREIKNNFHSELRKAAVGKQTSLPFIRHHLKATSIVKSGDIIQAIVVGGSNFQKALIQNVDNQVRIISHYEGTQPKFATKVDFMKFLEKHIHSDVEVVALNFAYPLSPVVRSGILDGILQSGSKENVFDGLVGKQVGDEIERHIKVAQNRDIKVCVANDVVCLLMSGLTQYKWDTIAAGIVGTGLNFAIYLDAHTAVNLESGDFRHFIQSEEAKEIDKYSSSPGMALFEKETSGAYLYKHFNLLAKKRNIHVEEINSGEELNSLQKHKNIEVSTLARKVLDHSASLVAAQIAGILEYSGHDLTFIMQGSLFWKADGYREYVERMVKKISSNCHTNFVQVAHSDLVGAAKLVI